MFVGGGLIERTSVMKRCHFLFVRNLYMTVPSLGKV